MEKYEIGECIGQGQFSRVYRARHRPSGRAVALKLIPKPLKAGDMRHPDMASTTLEALREEVKCQRSLDHPNILRLLACFETKDSVVFATELCHGDLLQLLKKHGKLPESRVQPIARQLVSGLEYIHSKNIIHRDLKLQNILVKDDGHVFISDFGFSKTASLAGNELLKSVKGTPIYMAPELIREEPYTYKVDIWALGIMLYELFVGLPPFYTTNIFNLVNLILNESIKWPKKISSDFKDLLMRLLEKDSEKRLAWPLLSMHPFLLAECSENVESRPQTMTQSTSQNTFKAVEKKRIDSAVDVNHRKSLGQTTTTSSTHQSMKTLTRTESFQLLVTHETDWTAVLTAMKQNQGMHLASDSSAMYQFTEKILHSAFDTAALECLLYLLSVIKDKGFNTGYIRKCLVSLANGFKRELDAFQIEYEAENSKRIAFVGNVSFMLSKDLLSQFVERMTAQLARMDYLGVETAILALFDENEVFDVSVGATILDHVLRNDEVFKHAIQSKGIVQLILNLAVDDRVSEEIRDSCIEYTADALVLSSFPEQDNIVWLRDRASALYDTISAQKSSEDTQKKLQRLAFSLGNHDSFDSLARSTLPTDEDSLLLYLESLRTKQQMTRFEMFASIAAQSEFVSCKILAIRNAVLGVMATPVLLRTLSIADIIGFLDVSCTLLENHGKWINQPSHSIENDRILRFYCRIDPTDLINVLLFHLISFTYLVSLQQTQQTLKNTTSRFLFATMHALIKTSNTQVYSLFFGLLIRLLQSDTNLKHEFVHFGLNYGMDVHLHVIHQLKLIDSMQQTNIFGDVLRREILRRPRTDRALEYVAKILKG